MTCLRAMAPTADIGPVPLDCRVPSYHVVAGLRREHGGPSYSVPSLAAALSDAGAPARIVTVKGSDASSAVAPAGVEVVAFAQALSNLPILSGLRFAPGLRSSLRSGLTSNLNSVVHDHGLWLMPNVDAGIAARSSGRPLVVSPRGMLAAAALSFSPRKKKLFWNLLQGPAFREVSCWHATAVQEYDEIRAFGLRAPVCVIPNGVTLPKPRAFAARPLREILFLGRLHPKKGIEDLVRAWAVLEADHPNWSVRIVGPAEDGHDRELRELAAAAGLSRVSVQPGVYGDEKNSLYRSADLFVLPSRNENFGLTIAEALAAETPVLATKCTPWSGLASEGCGWWIDSGIEPLVEALRVAMALPDDIRRQMGARGRAWVAREFSWDRIARDMLDVYRWLVHGGPVPSTVRLD